MTAGDHSCPGVESVTRQIKHELLAAAGETLGAHENEPTCAHFYGPTKCAG
jgi:hypothetical protein